MANKTNPPTCDLVDLRVVWNLTGTSRYYGVMVYATGMGVLLEGDFPRKRAAEKRMRELRKVWDNCPTFRLDIAKQIKDGLTGSDG
ncbi:MAG TPA: hypothetical protein VMY35_11325 [Phycisphaerae bacterium]|nr:hypothetical protein [Phycisphaerae bacterium]